MDQTKSNFIKTSDWAATIDTCHSIFSREIWQFCTWWSLNPKQLFGVNGNQLCGKNSLGSTFHSFKAGKDYFASWGIMQVMSNCNDIWFITLRTLVHCSGVWCSDCHSCCGHILQLGWHAYFQVIFLSNLTHNQNSITCRILEYMCAFFMLPSWY